jgi:two-component system LytT family response regulator
MKTIRTIIVEDILDNLDNLIILLERYCRQVTVVGHAASVDDAFDLIIAEKPELVFLDIGIRGGTSFDLLARLQRANRLDFEILFLTGEGRYEYATRAFEYSAIDFLIKPVDPEKLCRAVEKADQNLNLRQYRQQIDLMLDLLQQPGPSANGRMALHLPRGVIEFIQIEDIVRCEADSTVTYVFLENGQKYAAMRHLGHYSDLLVKDYNFFPISQSEIINLNHARRYNHAELALTLADGSVRYASRRGGQELRQYLNQSPQTSLTQAGPGMVKQLRNWLNK